MKEAEIITVGLATMLAIPFLFFTHWTIEGYYIWLGRRFCKKRGLVISRHFCGPEFEDSGVKTEYSIVEIDCLSPEGVRKWVKLRVWIFGIRKVLHVVDYPEEEKGDPTITNASNAAPGNIPP